MPLYINFLHLFNVTYCSESDKYSLYKDCQYNQGYKCKWEYC